MHRRWLWLTGAALIVVLAAGGGLWWVWQDGTNQWLSKAMIQQRLSKGMSPAQAADALGLAPEAIVLRPSYDEKQRIWGKDVMTGYQALISKPGWGALL